MDSSTMLSDVLFQKGIMVVWMEAYLSKGFILVNVLLLSTN